MRRSKRDGASCPHSTPLALYDLADCHPSNNCGLASRQESRPGKVSMGDQTSFGGSELAQQRAPQQQQQQQQLPSPPFVAVPNLNNLRDAALACGGLVTSDGRKLRSGVLFRSAEVSKLDAEGWKTMGAIGVCRSLVSQLFLFFFHPSKTLLWLAVFRIPRIGWDVP